MPSDHQPHQITLQKLLVEVRQFQIRFRPTARLSFRQRDHLRRLVEKLRQSRCQTIHRREEAERY